ncbi:uncharacterized protein METZ01_LOCUS395932, partial [marine metagenome]
RSGEGERQRTSVCRQEPERTYERLL